MDPANYPIVFTIHITSAAVSFCYFVLRGYWMLTESGLQNARINKVVPHVIDTILLGSAILLTTIIQQYPVTHDWLTIKVIALIAYILLGMLALKYGKTKPQKITAFIAAICTFCFIVSVAYYHQPLGLFY